MLQRVFLGQTVFQCVFNCSGDYPSSYIFRKSTREPVKPTKSDICVHNALRGGQDLLFYLTEKLNLHFGGISEHT